MIRLQLRLWPSRNDKAVALRLREDDLDRRQAALDHFFTILTSQEADLELREAALTVHEETFAAQADAAARAAGDAVQMLDAIPTVELPPDFNSDPPATRPEEQE